MPLYINLDAFEPGVHALDLREDASSFGFSGSDVEFVEPLHLALRLVRDGSTVVVSGQVEAEGRLACHRCLRPFKASLEAELHEIYHLVEGHAPPRADDDEGLHFVNRRASRVDIAPAVREQVLLEIPIKVLCDEGFRGLCPVCGVNRNEETCRCEPGRADPRWSGLRGLADRAAERSDPLEATQRKPRSNPRSNRREEKS
jgi:uncharacterized protein